MPRIQRSAIPILIFTINFHSGVNVSHIIEKPNFTIMNSPFNKPVFHKRIFWDVNFEALDYDKKAGFIIERVFERGDVEDIRQCRRYYGDKKVADILLHAKYLPERRLHLAAAVIDKPVTEFRCYTLRQSNQELFPY